MKVPCICIDDKNRPKQIPQEKWVIKGNQYHIIHVGGTVGGKIPTVSLSEITLGKECYPYEGFRLDRFAFDLKDIPKLIELMKSCSELSKVDIEELVKSYDLETVEPELN